MNTGRRHYTTWWPKLTSNIPSYGWSKYAQFDQNLWILYWQCNAKHSYVLGLGLGFFTQ